MASAISVPGSSSSSTSNDILDETKQGILHRNALHSQFNFTCLDTIHSKNLFCDVVLVAQGLEVHAHKLVLASCSTLFYWKFSKDRKMGLRNRIEIEYITFDTLSGIVDYLYKSEIFITEQNVEELLAAAYMLVLKDLQKACSEFMENNMNCQNVVPFRNIASKFKCCELLPKLDNYIGIHLSEVIKHQQFLELTHDQLVDLISSDEFRTEEVKILDCVFTWLRRDLQYRKGSVASLMKCIQFSLITHQDIIERFEKEQWLTSDAQCNSCLWEIFKNHFLKRDMKTVSKSRQSEACKLSKPSQEESSGLMVACRLSKYSQISSPGYPSELLVVVGIIDNYYLSMEMYDLQQNIWLRWPECIKLECGHYPKITILGSDIYCFKNDSITVMNFQNPAQMVTERFHQRQFKCEGIKGDKNRLYVLEKQGSVFDYHILVKMYDESGICRNLGTIDRAHCGFGFLKECFYAVGGTMRVGSIHFFSCCVTLYTPAKDCWLHMPNMSIARSKAGVGSIGDMLYVVGGCDEKGFCNQVEAFNYADCSWVRLPNMLVARSSPGVISIDGRLYVVGGHNLNGDLNSVEVYDPLRNNWSMLKKPMATCKNPVAVASIGRACINTTKST